MVDFMRYKRFIIVSTINFKLNAVSRHRMS